MDCGRGTAAPTRPSIYLPPSPPSLPSLIVYPVLMTLHVDKLHRENRKDRRRRGRSLFLPRLSFPSSLLFSPSSALQRRPLSVAIVTVGAVHFCFVSCSDLVSLLNPVTHYSLVPSPYDWGPEQSRAPPLKTTTTLIILLIFELTPPLIFSTRLYCLCEQHMVAVFMVSDAVC